MPYISSIFVTNRALCAFRVLHRKKSRCFSKAIASDGAAEDVLANPW
jgi:hypothetical protein